MIRRQLHKIIHGLAKYTMNQPIRYISTRGTGPAVTLSEAISIGLAPDHGLYVPERLPHFDPAHFSKQGTLADTATTLLTPFFGSDTRLAKELSAICQQALTFDTPVRALPNQNHSLMELFHGPTAAFKDVGARFLAACLQRLPRTAPLTILVATSGDTGAAVASAFHNQPGINVVILYPDGLVSPRQAHQFGCFGNNITSLRVQGNFDDCQQMVKAALNDVDLQTHIPLASANSINLGRLLPQMSYYAHAALEGWHKTQQTMNFIIPTGNLGNALACVWVREMGLPVGDIHLACNANATLPDFFGGAEYRPRAAISTLANAMDVGAPSNFERLRWTYPQTRRLRGKLQADSVDDTAIRQTISRYATNYGIVLCPHTATAAHLLDSKQAAGNDQPWTVVATAHPAKFEQIVEPLLGRSIEIPSSLAAMLARPSSADILEADSNDLREWLRSR